MYLKAFWLSKCFNASNLHPNLCPMLLAVPKIKSGNIKGTNTSSLLYNHRIIILNPLFYITTQFSFLKYCGRNTHYKYLVLNSTLQSWRRGGKTKQNKTPNILPRYLNSVKLSQCTTLKEYSHKFILCCYRFTPSYIIYFKILDLHHSVDAFLEVKNTTGHAGSKIYWILAVRK